MFKGSFKVNSRETFKGNLREVQRSFKQVQREFKGSFMAVSKTFKVSVKGV